ncbi:MAG: PEP-CTERM sorting domain-containing protein, partial [Planctomycetota bacterium]
MSSFLTHAIVASLALPAAALAGPYSGPSDTANALDGAIASSSGVFVEWADDIDASGTSFAPNGSTAIDTSGGFNSLGDLSQADIDNGLMPGQITVTFPTGIADGPGADFAVFENGFVFPSDPFLFAELAFVEVSSDGLTFARFPAISTNTTFQGNFGQSFGGFDTTNIFNLAGKHADGFGTPFDLSDLASDPLVTGGQVDLDAISAVRLVDVVGDGTTLDSLGNPIIDAWLTTGTGGFDFRLGVGTGVGVINVVPEPATGGVFAMAAAMLLRRRRRAASRSSAGLALAGAAGAVGLASVPAAAQTTITFEPLAPVSPDYPSNTGFTAGGVEFTGAAFSGWVAADGTDTTTPG